MPPRSTYFFRFLSYVALLAVAVYGVGWAFGRWPGDAELFLTCLTAFCGVYWLLDKILWAPIRSKDNERILAEYEASAPADPGPEPWLREEELEAKLAPPLWISNTAGSFVVLLLVWGVRSFLWEQFYVPSGSMVPTLRTGDAIAVNKWSNGLRIPGTQTWLLGPYLSPGDPLVFRYPEDPKMHFVKRVVAVEGDTVAYRNKTLTVNGKTLPQVVLDRATLGHLKLGDESTTATLFSETLPSSLSYTIQIEASHNSTFEPTERMLATWPNACVHDGSSVTCKVPARHAFVVGDNRDNSLDSRFWGFVPYESITGKATRYLFNAKAIGSSKPFSEIR